MTDVRVREAEASWATAAWTSVCSKFPQEFDNGTLRTQQGLSDLESPPWETQLQEVSSRPSPSRGLLGLLSLTEKCTSSPLLGAAPAGLACPRSRQPGQRRDHAPIKRAVTMTLGLHLDTCCVGPLLSCAGKAYRAEGTPVPACRAVPSFLCQVRHRWEMPLQGSVDSTMLITTLNPQLRGLDDVQSNMGKGLSKLQPGSGRLHRPRSPSPTL